MYSPAAGASSRLRAGDEDVEFSSVEDRLNAAALALG